MLRWTGPCDVPEGFGPSVVTVGVFDGVHRGHRVLLDTAVRRAADTGGRSVVVTFHPHPLAVLRPEVAPAALATLDQRLDLLAECGIDAVLVLAFTPELARQTAKRFVADVLAGALHATAVVVGQGFRFGHRAAGDVALLTAMGKELGFDVVQVPLRGDGGTTWSSSWVRERLLEGDVAAAAQALARPHRLEGIVVRGDQRGRAIGYPTANLDLPSAAAVPADGIYAGWLSWRDGRLPAAISIGTNPTFDGTVRRVEAYVLDRDDLELYGEHVALDFLARLRATLRFASVEELVEQMGRDVDQARKLTGQTPPSSGP